MKRPDIEAMDRRIKRWLLLFSLATLVILIVAAVKENYLAEWRTIRKEYAGILKKRATDQRGEIVAGQFEIQIVQNFLPKLGRVDRCITCHSGIDDPRMVNEKLPYSKHPGSYISDHPPNQFGCTVCHGGQGLATSKEDAHGPTESWNDAIYHQNFMQSACSMCHGEYIGEVAPVLARGRDLFTENRCRGCHKVSGRERGKIGPPIKRIGEKVRDDWLFRWLKNPREYLPETKMPNFLLSDREAADIAFILTYQQSVSGEEINGSYERGQQILRESRCVTCHPFEGKGGNIGPDLAKIGSKVYPGYLYQWLKNPHNIKPNTLMPVYTFTDQDVRDMVTFLMDEYIDLELEEEQAEKQSQMVKEGDLDRGSNLIEKYGCTGCHEIEGVEDRGEIGLELTTIADIHISRLSFGELHVPREYRTVPNWLYNKMKNPRVFSGDLKMPDYGFRDEEAAALTTYLLSLKAATVPKTSILMLGEPPSDYDPQGEFGKIIDRYRCLVCHRINGRGGLLAPDLTEEGSRVRKEWFVQYMKIPYAVRPILVERMPRLKITDREIEVLYSYFRSVLVDDRVEDLSDVVRSMALEKPEKIEAGKNIFYDKYGCDACHQVNLEGGTIGPDLTEAGVRLRPEWIVQYLRDPKTFLSRSVEPRYQLTDEEIEALAAYLTSSKK